MAKEFSQDNLQEHNDDGVSIGYTYLVLVGPPIGAPYPKRAVELGAFVVRHLQEKGETCIRREATEGGGMDNSCSLGVAWATLPQ